MIALFIAKSVHSTHVVQVLQKPSKFRDVDLPGKGALSTKVALWMGSHICIFANEVPSSSQTADYCKTIP